MIAPLSPFVSVRSRLNRSRATGVLKRRDSPLEIFSGG
jgi:hypothetical protein